MRLILNRGNLIRLGFVDPTDVQIQLNRLGFAAEPLVALIARTADPDRALSGVVALAEAASDRDALLRALVDDEGTAMRTLSVLGASAALTEHLLRRPEHWRELTDPLLGSTRPTAQAMRSALLTAVGASAGDDVPVAALPVDAAMDALRVEYRRLLLRLASRDLAHHLGLDDVAAELSDLAAGTLEAALAIARARVGDAAAGVRLAVIAMGKCGGHELNYVSDVDVIFVYESSAGTDDAVALRVATQLAVHLIQVCSENTAEGTIWPVDAGLRPEGRSGPLVRTLASHVSYYERWATTWEFQALLKARPVAGDRSLGEAYVAALAPLVWSAAERDHFVEDVQTMRRRVLDHIPQRPGTVATRQLKLGSGGLRDVEFAVQLLQLVHGRSDESLREPATLSALAALTRGGYVGRPDGESLHEAYLFLRSLEHRIQLHRLERTHVVPDDEYDLRRLGRSLGHLKDPVGGLEKQWRHHRREVRRLHEKLFYRPLLAAVARIRSEDVRLTPEAAHARLAALGFQDPDAALRHLQALTEGVSRTAAIQRALLPAMLSWCADAPDPDAGLLGFRQLSEAMGATPWYLRLLRDEGEVAQRLAIVLSSSRFATDLLQREPQGVKMLGEPLRPLSADVVGNEMRASIERHQDAASAIAQVRGIRRRELLRISAGDLLGELDVAEVGEALSRLTDATLQATLEVAEGQIQRDQFPAGSPTRMAIVAMGRYGGFELSYGSDADVMFVHDPEPEADAQAASSYAHAVANEIRRLLALPASDPALEIDAGLRPEGKQGPLVRSLASYAAYYAKWSNLWEAQALLRADAVVGDKELRARFHELIDPLRYPAGGIGESEIAEVRRIKARVDEERLPRDADRLTHLKLGRGGLADVEWTAQLLQMRHAGAVPSLRTPRTIEALTAAVSAGLLAAGDAEALIDAWRLASKLRNAVTLVRGRPADQLPHDPRERAAVASLLSYPQGASEQMLNDYLRTTRLAHQAVERIFWGN
jgi:[glutamine synthetase] adenylyltransferase / [glutamine synthetase]-adenylyl-L-tyrosine phosphorylase